MTETKNPGEKTLTVTPTKTLTLKRSVEQGVVRQSFSHGRTKAVVVEKVKRRTVSPGDGKVADAAPADRGRAHGSSPCSCGIESQRDRGAAACRRSGPPTRGKRNGRAGRTGGCGSTKARGGGASPPRRGDQAQGRDRGQETFRRGGGQAKERCAAAGDGGCAGRYTPYCPGSRRGRCAATCTSRRWRRPSGAGSKAGAKRIGAASRPAHAGDCADGRRGARTLSRIVSSSHP